jgi:hypothetical protein
VSATGTPLPGEMDKNWSCIRIAIQNESRTGLRFTPGLIGGVAVEADQVVGRPGEVVELVLEVLRPGAQVGQQQVTHLRAPAHTHRPRR